MKGIKIILSSLVFFLVVFQIFMVKAAITLEEPKKVYNLGDTIKVTLKVVYPENLFCFLKLRMECKEQNFLMYFSPLRLEENSEKTIELEWPLNKKLSDCHLVAFLESDGKTIEKYRSERFDVSSKARVSVSLNKYLFQPKETVVIEGKATKESGESLEGNVNLEIDGKSYRTVLEDGKFSFTFNLSENIAPGIHTIKVIVNDSYGNHGEKNITFNVTAVPSFLLVEVSNKSVFPNTTFSITPKLLDQAKGIMKDWVAVKITRKKLFAKETFLEKIVRSNEPILFRFSKETEPGNYKVEVSYKEMKNETIVEVLPLEKISVVMEGNTIVFENVGNVPYKRTVEIKFEGKINKTKLLNLNLDVNEIKSYKVLAPPGTYRISVNTGKELLNFSSQLGGLTGNVIAMVEPKARQKKLILIIFFLFVLLVLLLFLRKRLRHKIKGRKLKERKKGLEGSERKGASPKLKRVFERYGNVLEANKLNSSLVYGNKQEVSVLAVKFDEKEIEEKTKEIEELIVSAVSIIKKHKGVADIQDSFLVVLFNVIKQYRHDVAAVRTAEAIVEKAKELKLKVRASIHVGKAIISFSKESKEVIYCALEDTIRIAKALTKKADENEIVISDVTEKRLRNIIKTRKLSPLAIDEKKAINAFALEPMTKSELKKKYEWFIEKALKS